MDTTMWQCGAEVTQTGWATSCFTSLLAFAFVHYYYYSSDFSTAIIDTPKVDYDYDFVVIGVGAAGAVVANRLSEVKKWKVLVLEAGGSESNETDVPLLAGNFVGTEFDWKYKSELPKHGKNRPEHGRGYCLSMTDYECNMARGKVVGGSTVINYLLYVRGNKNDYNYWEHLGNKGWGYEDVLRYFLKSENNANPKYLQTPYHASGGPLNVQDIPYTTPMADAFLKSAPFFGLEVGDTNGENQEVFTTPQVTERNGRRCSSSKAFVAPVQKRPNLSVSLHSFVTRIGFVKEDENSAPTARTVHFFKGNKEYSVTAKEEIILCAGVMNSPKILMLSGIGPTEHLQEHGITEVKNLNVGHNLQDHISSGGLIFKVDEPVTVKYAPAENPDCLYKYLMKGEGPLTSPVAVEGHAFIKSWYADPSNRFPGPDIQLNLQSLALYNNNNTQPFGNALFNLRPDLFNGTEYNNLLNTNLFGIYPVPLQPESRGWVMLRSKDPFVPPRIVPNYLESENDVRIMVYGLQKALELVTLAPHFKELNAAPLDIPFPGCEEFKMFSNDYFECISRHFPYNFWHPVGTCKMGVDSDAVVDPRLRVWGVKRLRVIDGSIMPKITRGNPGAPIMMIGEKGSDMIKEDHNHRA